METALLNTTTERVFQLVKVPHTISPISFTGLFFAWQIWSTVITFLTVSHSQEKNTEQILQLDMLGLYL